MNRVNEATVVRQILSRAKQIEDCLIIKRHGGAFSQSGQPDLHGCIAGRAVEIEVKAPGKKPTALQQAAIEKWQAVGAICGWVDSVDKFEKLLADAGVNLN